MQISKFWLKRSSTTDYDEEELVTDQPDEQELHRFAWTFRLVNVVLHSIATQLFAYILVNYFSVDVKHGFLASIHFAIHPIHTEAVIIFAFIIFILSFLFYFFFCYHFLFAQFQRIQNIYRECTVWMIHTV